MLCGLGFRLYIRVHRAKNTDHDLSGSTFTNLPWLRSLRDLVKSFSNLYMWLANSFWQHAGIVFSIYSQGCIKAVLNSALWSIALLASLHVVNGMLWEDLPAQEIEEETERIWLNHKLICNIVVDWDHGWLAGSIVRLWNCVYRALVSWCPLCRLMLR